MTISRREFLKTSAVLIGSAALPSWIYGAAFTDAPLPVFDENALADVSLALAKRLGASYSDTYAGDTSTLTRRIKAKLGFNDSALHWDLVNTEKKRVTAHLKNGQKTVIYENGKFSY